MLKWHNKIQEIGERSRLGFYHNSLRSSTWGTKHFWSFNITPYFSKWPSALGLGVTQDSLLV